MLDKEKSPHPTPQRARRGRYVHRLNKVSNVRMEMSRIYREARLGHLRPGDGTKMIYMLATIGRVIEGSDLERRIAQLEARLEAEEQLRLEATL